MGNGNSFGNRFVVTSFGESHGAALGAVIDGCPAGIDFDLELLARELARRKPGGALVSGRQESDAPEILSGVFEGKTLGTPIALLVRNTDARSQDYAEIAKSPRPGHADSAWKEKFGHVDPRGGGRSSGRETVARVMAGAVAQMLLKKLHPGIRVSALATHIGSLALTAAELEKNSALDCARVQELLSRAKSEGKSYGGIAEIRVTGLPAGLGQPVFHKLKADLAGAFVGIGATSGVEFGAGFDAARAEGSEFHSRGADHADYGGISGGISTGDPLQARVAFKPTSSVLDVAKKGRHDPCIVPRALPILEAMTWLVLADHALWMKQDHA